jgi:hypothetical protein
VLVSLSSNTQINLLAEADSGKHLARIAHQPQRGSLVHTPHAEYKVQVVVHDEFSQE